MIRCIHLLLCVAVLAAALRPAPSTAQPLQTAAAHVKVDRYHLSWTVRPDATAVSDQTVVRQALSDEGAQAITKDAHQYNTTLQALEVLEAYTLKPDGRRVDVGPAGLQTQRGIAGADAAASWPDAEILQITFPDVQKGDRTEWRIRVTQIQPPLPGWARLRDYLMPLVAYDDVQIRIEAPASLPLAVTAAGLPLTRTTLEDKVRWEARGQVAATVLDSQPANALDSLPHVLASTIATPEDLAAAYAETARPKLVVSEDVRALARTITAGHEGDAQKAASIHDWVRRNIRYVAAYLGAGGWTPHDVDWILRQRYGDCKDHVLLTQALLRAAGIEAVPALVDTSEEYTLPALPVNFNHAVLYIPSLQRFIDPTDSRIPFGALPLSVAGKPLAVALAPVPRVLHAPAFNAEDNHVRVATRLRLDASGKATGSIEAQARGMAATQLQDVLAQYPADMRQLALRKVLEADHWRGRGSLEFPPVQRKRRTQGLRIPDIEIDNLVNDPRGGSVNPHPKLLLPIYIMRHTGHQGAASRTLATACIPISVREEFELSFDPAYELLRLPGDMQESSADGIEFKARYRREGATIRGWRQIRLSQARHVCTPEQYARRKPTMDRILQHLRSGVLYSQAQ